MALSNPDNTLPTMRAVEKSSIEEREAYLLLFLLMIGRAKTMEQLFTYVILIIACLSEEWN